MTTLTKLKIDGTDYTLQADTTNLLASTKYSGKIFTANADGSLPSGGATYSGYWRGHPTPGSLTTEGSVIYLYGGLTLTSNGMFAFSPSTPSAITKDSGFSFSGGSGFFSTSYVYNSTGDTLYFEFTFNKKVILQGFHYSSVYDWIKSAKLEYWDGSAWQLITENTSSLQTGNSKLQLNTAFNTEAEKFRWTTTREPTHWGDFANFQLVMKNTATISSNPWINNVSSTGASVAGVSIDSTKVHNNADIIVQSSKPYIKVPANTEILLKSDDPKTYTLGEGKSQDFTVPAGKTIRIYKV